LKKQCAKGRQIPESMSVNTSVKEFGLAGSDFAKAMDTNTYVYTYIEILH